MVQSAAVREQQDAQHLRRVDETVTLADRTFHCQQCGLVMDRDLIAAINLVKLAGVPRTHQTPVAGSALAGVGRLW
jgi:transposase